MDPEEYRPWLRLSLCDGVGAGAARRLLSVFGGPEAIFAQTRDALLAVVSPAQADALLTLPAGFAADCDRVREWLAADPPPRRLIALGDPLYPSSLLHIADPPLLLYAMGQVHTLAALPPCLAVVGSRNPTPQGEAHARRFALVAASSGLCIVSGLALGIDGATHRGALDAEGAPLAATLAVVGTGLDRVYPKRHLELAHAIAQRGVLISECPLGTPPLAHNFPRRNRLISGLSRATLVVEAALQSGSLITAREALEQGRDVMAIPGSIDSPQSRGCHALIKQGARLVETPQEVLEELGLASAARETGQPPVRDERVNEGSSPLLAALGHEPVGLDDLVARTGLDAAALQAQLLECELLGQVRRLPGARFQRMPSA